MGVTQYDFDAIFADLASGMTRRDICRKYGIGYTYLSRMCTKFHIPYRDEEMDLPTYLIDDSCWVKKFETEWRVVTEYVLHGLGRMKDDKAKNL